MVKTNAERQAEYRLRQQGAGDKKRLNIWLSSRAHKELSALAKRKGMSQQVLIEWLLTESLLLKEESPPLEASNVIAAGGDVEKLLSNDAREEGGGKSRKRFKKLLRNSVPEAGDSKSGAQPGRIEQAPSLPPPAQFELKL